MGGLPVGHPEVGVEVERVGVELSGASAAIVAEV